MRLKVANSRGAPTLAVTLLLASLSMISPLSIDTFLPSFPAIAAEYDISSWQVQQIITAYLLPFAAFSLVHGPLSDALGRRQVVIGGLVLYTVGSVGCLLAPNFGLLLLCRVLQGMAAGIGPTVSRAIVRDFFEGAHAQRLMSSMMLVFSLAPAVAPIVGGWLHVAFGWRSVFGMLVAIGAALLLVCALVLPESHPPEKRSAFHPADLARSCWRIGTGRAFFLLAISAALTMAALFIYIGSAPAIIVERWQLKETQFHYIFIPVVAGFMVSSIIGGRLAGRVSRSRLLAGGFALLCFAGLGGVVAHLFTPAVPIPLVQFFWFCMALGAQMTFPVLSLEMIDMHPEARGAAASVQSFISLGVGAVMMGMVAPLLHGDLRLLAWISLAMAVLGLFAWRAGSALARRQARYG